MADSKTLIAGQAKAVLGLLQPDDRQIIEAHIADQVATQEVVKVRWAGFMGVLTVVGVVAAVSTAVAFFAFLIIISEVRPVALCEGWCAHEGMAFTTTDDRTCDCVPSPDPSRIWRATPRPTRFPWESKPVAVPPIVPPAAPESASP